MTSEEKINILLSRIRAGMVLPGGQEEKLREALIEGLLQIAQCEAAFKRAVSPLRSFPVELVKEGFCLWICGGFNAAKKKGTSIVASGYDGRPLKILQTAREKNGRHALCLVYPGCFVAQATVVPNGDACLDLYQIVSFSSRTGACEARCQCLYNIGPSYSISRMEPGEEKKFSGLLGAAEAMASCGDNVSTKYGW